MNQLGIPEGLKQRVLPTVFHWRTTPQRCSTYSPRARSFSSVLLATHLPPPSPHPHPLPSHPSLPFPPQPPLPPPNPPPPSPPPPTPVGQRTFPTGPYWRCCLESGPMHTIVEHTWSWSTDYSDQDVLSDGQSHCPPRRQRGRGACSYIWFVSLTMTWVMTCHDIKLLPINYVTYQHPPYVEELGDQHVLTRFQPNYVSIFFKHNYETSFYPFIRSRGVTHECSKSYYSLVTTTKVLEIFDALLRHLSDLLALHTTLAVQVYICVSTII